VKLLERIVVASSRPGALVLDPFCGSGTTLAAALTHGRNAVGMDIGALAIDTTSKRLRDAGATIDVTDGRTTHPLVLAVRGPEKRE
jgi:DNA modification methylase